MTDSAYNTFLQWFVEKKVDGILHHKQQYQNLRAIDCRFFKNTSKDRRLFICWTVD